MVYIGMDKIMGNGEDKVIPKYETLWQLDVYRKEESKELVRNVLDGKGDSKFWIKPPPPKK